MSAARAIIRALAAARFVVVRACRRVDVARTAKMLSERGLELHTVRVLFAASGLRVFML